MENIDIFAERIRKLRECHGLNYVDLPRISQENGVCRINPLSVRNWEKGKYYLSAEGIIVLTEMFGINGNWLLGLSDEMYSDDVLSRLENRNGPSFPAVKVAGKNICVPLEYSDSYSNIFLRRDIYTLEDRGNIIYCIFAICYEWREFLAGRSYELNDGLDDGKLSKMWEWFVDSNEFVSKIVNKYKQLMFDGLEGS